jgi:dolichol-phosphate mannosyltransferase
MEDGRSLKKHAIVIPTYNERENIGLLVEGILNLDLGSQVIIVDDSSPDGTGHLADDLAAQHSGVQVLHRPEKLGLGTAHIAGMKAAIAARVAYIVTMDADFSHHPRYLPDLLAALEHYDVVIGSRYVAGGGTLYCTAPRKALSRGANLFARTMLSLQAGDATAGFRGYRRAVLESIALDEILSDGYSFLIEMLYRCQQRGWCVGEVPIVFENRQRGASKISRTEIFKALGTVGGLSGERLGRRPATAPSTAECKEP